MKNIIVGLLGFGNVGTGFAAILEENRKIIENTLGCSVIVKKILVRDPGKYRDTVIPEELFTADADEILTDPEIHIIVELIGGIQPACDYIKKALENGKHVVTANKAVIALYGKELFELADKNRVSIRFEGSVGGGIPIISSLTKSLAANEIEEIVGIINGTTNYILTRMDESGLGFQEALAEAQSKGFAEADPTSDIEGEDAAYKLAILTHVAFGVQVNPKEIPYTGIGQISEKEIDFARQLGYKIKLLATVRRHDGCLDLHVHPALVPFEHPLAAVSYEYNALYIRGNAVGEVMLYGKGAGSLPTGSAVLGDVIEVVQIIKNKIGEKNTFADKYQFKPKAISSGSSAYYIRLQVKDRPGVLGKITTAFGRNGISLESVVQRGRGGLSVPLIFVTHEADREMLDAALKEVSAIESVEEVASILLVQNKS
ncbi:MAG TPA: homoserine dehydrogenase [Clostridiales bacterium]|jgi:homoserine dehydrogenase|nr:homoserine dehydrogenase [Clostridiales bacterium]